MREFLTALIECSVSMSALALVFMALIPTLSKRYAAKWIYYAWLVIVIGLIVPFRVRFHTVFIRADAIPSPLRQVLPRTAGNAAAAQVVTANQGFPAVPWVPAVLALWLAGAAAFLLYHGLRHARFLMMVKRWSEPADDPQMLEALESIKRDMGIAGRVRLQLCPCVSTPMMTGFRDPVLLLPRSRFSMDELPYILRHEMVHFKRKDLWFKSLVILATALHWFNPVVYLVARAVALQCEISCDAEVVSGIGLDGRRRYSETILGAIKRQSNLQTVFSTNFYSGKAGMRKRIFSIMDTKKKKVGVVVLCLILIGTLGTGAALAAGNQGESEPGSSRQGSVSSIQTIAGKWAEAVKKRDGKAQYDLLSPKCQSAVYDAYDSNGWTTGTSSPWVESYEVSAYQNGATVTYQYATSTGFAGAYEQALSFVNQNGKLCIDGFSDPEEVPQAGSNAASDPKGKAFLDSADGSSFQQTANRFVKAYLIGDVREMKRNLSDPGSNQNDFSMDGKTVNWKSLTLKLDSKEIGENTVSAEYEIALAETGGFQKLYLNMGKIHNEWKINSYKIEK
ncbi:M56 family metallopeptidase [Caproiciproducens sp. NJN-50]|uniref:M56 family metallopeptidase n=1 Tax=Caproiciproducens sp. NJN-50 TaxID=2507162 RepID=UPI000FFE0773|nr:M56 family metallopeptidase [Caproiciproducens sp. NJN-50]QAT48968.1 M56 family metallopeptidase [Caproiciproducens sp. NJN-50]